MSWVSDRSLGLVSTPQTTRGMSASSRHREILAVRLQTGCVYEPQPRETFGLLVMRTEPRRGVCARVDAWWPLFAPSMELLTLRSRDKDRLGWDSFSTRYWAELQAVPRATYFGALIQIGRWLKTHPTVTILSLERCPSIEEERAWSQRRILRSWLLGQRVPFVEVA